MDRNGIQCVVSGKRTATRIRYCLKQDSTMPNLTVSRDGSDRFKKLSPSDPTTSYRRKSDTMVAEKQQRHQAQHHQQQQQQHELKVGNSEEFQRRKSDPPTKMINRRKTSTSTASSSSSSSSNNSIAKDSRQNSFENRYKPIIHKQILETSCNTEEVKRQLHIFMPFGQHSKSEHNQQNRDESDESDTTDTINDNECSRMASATVAVAFANTMNTKKICDNENDENKFLYNDEMNDDASSEEMIENYHKNFIKSDNNIETEIENNSSDGMQC